MTPLQRDNAELLPCPFCGSEAVIGYRGKNAGANVVECSNRECRVCPHTNPLSNNEAIAAWNTRSLSPQPDTDVVERAKAAMLTDLRDRRFLKYLFAEEPESCGAYGYVDTPFDRIVQDEIVTALATAALNASTPEIRTLLACAQTYVKLAAEQGNSAIAEELFFDISAALKQDEENHDD